MSQENLSALRTLYEAYRRKDLPAIFIPTLFEVFDPEIEIYQSELLPWGGRYRGHDEAGEFFGRLTRSIDSRLDTEEFVQAGDQLVVLGYSRGHVRASGRPFEVRAVHIWTMRDGKAVRFEAYIDTPKMLRALEQDADRHAGES